MKYYLIVLSLFLIFYVGLEKSILNSLALGFAVAFLLITFMPVNNYAPSEKKQTKEVWV